jgi:predicted phage terminase large subunit-like protein
MSYVISSEERLKNLVLATRRYRLLEEREKQAQEGGLIEFVRYFWPVLEPATEMVEGWVLEAITEHLEAVTFGDITRLLVNVPPGFMKSLCLNVFWPAWEWGPMDQPHQRYVCFSYTSSLTERDNGRFRDLIRSREYQELWGHKFQLKEDGKVRISNDKTGWKLASSIGGVGTGERGSRVLIDDPHAVHEAESEVVRKETVRWFRESMSNRLNDMEESAILIICQRVHESDVSDAVLTEGMNYEHLSVPMTFDSARHCKTSIGWEDPRKHDGEFAWPERFPLTVVQNLKRDIGMWAWASQYEQSPAPRGGGIFARDAWAVWAPPDNKFPAFEYIVASLDGAFSARQESDFSALTVWGVFRHPKDGQRRICLITAWQKRLDISGDHQLLEWLPSERNAQMGRQLWRQRTERHWGLLQWVHESCCRYGVHKLLIEDAASGKPVAQMLQNWNRHNMSYAIQLVRPSGDKVARALSVQPLFGAGLIYAPVRDWSEILINQAATFPKGKHDDLVDSMTQGLRYLRDCGLAQNDEEVSAEENERVTHDARRFRKRALYPV